MNNQTEPKPDRILLKFDGKEITIVERDFLPAKTIALSKDLFNELSEKKNHD